MERPTLAVWLDTLDEIPQLQTLTLHSASPVAAHFPSDVERTVTLPSLTHLDISGCLKDCAVASAHLVLPALTSLCLTAIDPTNGWGAQEFLLYVARHIHGPQDSRPPQSVLIRGCENWLELLAWPVPDIDTLVHDPPAFLGATLPTRVKLSFRIHSYERIEVFEKLMAALPLDGLLTLAAVDLGGRTRPCGEAIMQQFWCNLLPNWPLLRRVRLGATATRGFMEALLVNCKNSLLPSLTEIVLVDTILDPHSALFLSDGLRKRVEQGVPLKTLDLRMCHSSYPLAVQLLSEIVVDVLRPLDFLGPEDTEESRDAGLVMLKKMITMWKPLHPYVPLLRF